MTFKKITGKIHLWLGLTSGLLVVFLGITGCILVFQQEIESVTAPYQFVQPENTAYIQPSVLKKKAETMLPYKMLSVEYPAKDKAARAYYYDAKEYYNVFLNPYNGYVLKVKNMNRDFFRVVLNGHFYLWLPPNIGQPIVATGTLIFVVMLISGIILWWPKNKAARKQRFKVKWDASRKRLNYDLHNVFGFYVCAVALVIALSGLVMGFQWFSKTVEWVANGGKASPEEVHPVSDTTKYNLTSATNADKLWAQYLPKVTDESSMFVTFPAAKNDPIEIGINDRPGTYYKQDYYHFDQYTMQPLKAVGAFEGKYSEASVADKVARMNYDIHVGAIGGIFTKILAFFASFIIASLPITGFILWRGRKKKSKKPAVASLRLKPATA